MLHSNKLLLVLIIQRIGLAALGWGHRLILAFLKSRRIDGDVQFLLINTIRLFRLFFFIAGTRCASQRHKAKSSYKKFSFHNHEIKGAKLFV